MGGRFPKPLVTVGGAPLLGRTLRALERAGVREAAVVVGHRAAEIVASLARWGRIGALRVHIIANPDYHLPNGVSLAMAARFVSERTLVLMADHLFAPSMLAPLLTLDPAGDEAVLAIDRDLPTVFDLDDATKVRTEGASLVDIGKQIERYDAVDTGLFCVSPALVRLLLVLDAPQLSDGVRALARAGLMQVRDVTGGRWIDVDTPLARTHAEWLVRRYGDDLDGAPNLRVGGSWPA
jgi:choline kinase